MKLGKLLKDNKAALTLFEIVFIALLIVGIIAVWDRVTLGQAERKPLAIERPGVASTTAPAATTLTQEMQIIASLERGALLGKGSSVTPLYYDQEADSVSDVSTSVSVTAIVKKFNRGTMSWESPSRIKSAGSYLAGTAITDVSVGDKLSLYAINNTAATMYYADPVIDRIITTEKESWSINAYMVATEASLTITGYDDTGVTALSGGTNTSQEDSDITMTSGEEKDFFVKLKNDDTDSRYNAAGFAVLTTHNATDFKFKTTTVDKGAHKGKPAEAYTVSATQILISKNLSNTVLNSDEIDISGWEQLYQFDRVIPLQEFDSLKVHGTAVAHSTNDPVTGSRPTNSSIIGIIFLDANYYADAFDATKVGYGMFDNAAAPINIGRQETVSSPLGLDSGIVIELI